MTATQLRDFVERVSFGYPFKACGMRAFVHLCPFHRQAQVVVECRSTDRDDGRANFVCSAETWDEAKLKSLTKWGTLEALRSLGLQLLSHELDESFTVDGVRVFDPHMEEQFPTHVWRAEER